MKRKIITIIVSMIFCMTLFLPAAAIDGEEQPPRLVDEAELLIDDEESSLADKLDTVSDKWQCDVAIVTVDSLGNKTATEFADDYFDYNGYGYGDNNDGIMLVISMENRDWAITTHSFGI